MAEETPALSKETEHEVDTQIHDYVDLILHGTPEEIADKMRYQYVDRSSTYNSWNIPSDDEDALEVLPDIKQIVKNVSDPVRRDYKLSYPPSCYSEDDPITCLYNGLYHFPGFSQ